LQNRPLSDPTAAIAQPSEEIERLKQELAEARKEKDDLQTRVAIADSFTGNDAEANTRLTEEQVAERTASLKAALAESEAKLANAQSEIEQLKAQLKPSDDTIPPHLNQKMENLKKKCNEIVNKKTVKITALEEEIIELRKQLESAESAPKQSPGEEAAASNITTSVKTETLPGPTTTDREIQDWINDNSVARAIIKRTVLKRLQEAKAGQDKSTVPNTEEPLVFTETDQGKVLAQKIEEVTAALKAEHEKDVADKVEKQRETVEKRFAAKDSLNKGRFNKLNAQWNVVETAAKEEPNKPVKEVYDLAKTAKPPPAPIAGTPIKVQPPAQPPAQPASLAVQPGQAQPVNVPTAMVAPNGTTQHQTAPQSISHPNGIMPNAPSQQVNPFAQSHGMGFPNPMQNQTGAGLGFGGSLPQPGFAASHNQQAPFFQQQHGRPNSPFGQPQLQHQHQQAGRGRGDFGTGPAALRNIVGQQPMNQSSIPRGGASGIPQPGGRGRGGQQQQVQGPNANAQGSGQSQIGRGGGRGGGRGRGGQGPTPGSPGMNPGATNFQPGGGRGQKRGAEDDGGGTQRGGKRPRGGRGGPQGGGEE
jgi:nucleoprotein TPR